MTYQKALVGRPAKLYLLLGMSYVAALLAANLVFKKFVSVPFFFGQSFEVSLGTLVYPVTFLMTDIINEIYGERLAHRIVINTLVLSLCVNGAFYLFGLIPATGWSPLSDSVFEKVFGELGVVLIAGLFASYVAQFVDIKIYAWIGRLTKGRHLWLRNNVSTLVAQLADSFALNLIFVPMGILPLEKVIPVIVSSYAFKAFFALADTPFCYLGRWAAKKYIGEFKK